MPRTSRPTSLLALAPVLTLALVLAATGCRRLPHPPTADPSSAATGAVASGPSDTAPGATAPAPSGAPLDGIRARLELPGTPTAGAVPVAVYLLDGTDGASGAIVTVHGERPDGAVGVTDAGPATADAGDRAIPSAVTAREIEPGLYRVDALPLAGSGRWRIVASVRLADGRTGTFERSVDVPPP